MLTLFIAVLVVILVIYGLLKGAAPQAVLLLGGVALLFFTAWLRDTPLMVAEHSANWRYFDIFYLIGSVMSNRLAGIGLTIMTISGFARYMEHVGASHALFAIFERPLRRIRSPYLLLVLGFLLSQVLVLFIPSHSGLALLLMVTLYPIFIRCGVSKLSALGVIGCAQFIDHGPSGPVILAAELSGMDPVIYFVHHQLPVTLPIIAAVALSHYVVQRWWDRRETAAPLTEGRAAEAASLPSRPPLCYALLPVLPLALIMAFSPLFASTVRISIVAAMLISILTAMLFELVRLRQPKLVLGSLMIFIDGMGKAFVLVVSLIICGEVFANGLIKIGAIDALTDGMHHAGFGVGTMMVIMSLMLALAAFLMGSGNAAFFPLAGIAPDIAGSLNIEVITLMLPMQIMTSFGRTVSPITAAIVAIAAIANVSPLQVVKRTAIPMAVAAAVNLALNLLWL
ncbi:C4-dicarboxylate transporter DcuC [Edwardsiella ictaluri]|uniref:C4-dicarboxylate transporter DcuC n=1 Tax=Edwardsiella ictaluri TaxID=67780 RepID=UPI0018DC7A26|nr:C4-dicarboxylate transporter DcuC [Edwardsiella ictaluri]QPW29692.1 C4-dicarboxylate transporter DcuC [Edwardsiella ictaluri]UYB62813.1 C4-dicarboxylate transporter DcuC [Edwardsiella ictaluri]UYB66039.1 C4-dicarboxylate transporter DcuC [Edwardsiella ictaluri]WJH20725.1 C4-dicarboxylate ABC transporter [Edwardsiella ictaluri]BEH98496.1 C4-dicarboxylate transporter DcuC [Edwardsiella ictaluri]